MDSLNLPMHLAQFADWEYAELTLTGSETRQVPVHKSGILPVINVSGTNYISLADPARAGIEVTVVQVRRDAGSLRIQSATGNVYFKTGDGSLTAGAYATLNSTDGFLFRFISIPVYVSGVRTYRWYSDSVHG